MSVRMFRLILIAFIVSSLAGAFIDTLIPGLVPDAFLKAQEAQDELLFTSGYLIFIGLAVITVLVTFVVAIIGLYRFRPWAPKLSLVITVISYPIVGMSGASAMSGVALAVMDLSATCWGVVLAAAYFSTIRDKFSGEDR